MKQKLTVGFFITLLSFSLIACSAENNENEDLQNGDPAIGEDDERENPTGDELEEEHGDHSED